MPAPTNCNASFTTAYTLPDVPFTACADPSISWSFSAIESGENYTLILVDTQQGLAASKVWDKADFPVINAGSTVYQQYSGDSSFVVQY
jgi:GH43 family beta-xylosidase